MRAVAKFAIAVAVAAISAEACSTSEAGPGPEAPPPLRPAAATEIIASLPPPEASPSCPDGMLLIDGEYCTEVHEVCDRWMEPPTNPMARCARFAPSVCVGERVKKRYCVDRDEYVAPGQELPLGGVSWSQARDICEAQSKRLCMESEWEFACEGEAMFPYTTGYTRDAVSCNFDKLELVDRGGNLRDLRQRASDLDRCVSPFGVRNMSGNVDEWVWRDRTPGDWRSALKGGWWTAAREQCRPATTFHAERYRELQTGVRCCSDAGASPAAGLVSQAAAED